MNCPQCNRQIDSSRINIQADIAQCQSCDFVFKISTQLNISSGATNSYDETDSSFDMNTPPAGAWLDRGFDSIIIGATTRSPIAFFLVPFMLVWSGGSIGGIYGSQIIDGEFNIVMSLFGIPFLLGSIIFWSIALMAIFGKIEITITREGGRVFTGLGSVGYTQRFSWDEVSKVKERITHTNRQNNVMLALEGKRRITFGFMLNSTRRYYLLRSMQTILKLQKQNANFIG